MAVNAKGTWLMSRAAIPALVARRRRSDRQPRERDRLHGLARNEPLRCEQGRRGRSHARAFARELGPLGIRVNAIAPGYTDTEGGRTIGDPATYDVSATPLGRVAEPEDMVGTLLHLLGPGSAFVTGQVVLVNGGRVTG